MSLASEILEAAVNGDELTPVLRKTLVLAHRLRYEPLIEWVSWELDGYPKTSDSVLPSYRIGKGIIYVHLVGPVNEDRRYALPYVPDLLPDLRAKMEAFTTFSGVREVEVLAQDTKGLARRLEPEALAVLNLVAPLSTGTYIKSAWVDCPIGYHEGILSGIRNRLIKFMLRMQDELPDEDWTPSPQAEVITAVNYHTIIIGDVETYSPNNKGVIVRQAANQVVPNNRPTLERYLREIGVPDEEIAEFNDLLDEPGAIEQLADQEGPLRSWAQRVGTQVARGGKVLSVEVITDLLAQGILRFSGMGIDTLAN